jgi:hypothetical protein
LASVILGTLPLAVGIALNPIAVVAGILVLSTAHPRLNGLLFTAGWLLGLGLLVVLSARLVVLQSRGSGGDGLYVPAIIWVVIGVLLLAAAAQARRGRQLPSEEPITPAWLRMIDTASGPRVFGIGFFLATISARNLALVAAAAGAMGEAELGSAEFVVTMAVFLVVSSIGILVPLLVRLLGGSEADERLARWSAWLNLHVATITSGVLGVLGVYLLLRGVVGMVS